MLPPLADHLRLLCFLLLILLFHAPVLAAPSDYNEDAIRLVIDETKSMVKNKTTEFEELTKASERLGTTLTSVRQCVKSNKEELDKVSQSLEELGAKGVDESNEVS
ncbi:MAG: hypothetical protein Q8J76_15095, partial [Desulfobulbaceae bacterium]|nr:hypothetical protein [Desulfobulbaceae bacterium]